MSLVGTRPPTVDEWDKYELHHRARLATKPGLTGMWQVSGRSNITDFLECSSDYIVAYRQDMYVHMRNSATNIKGFHTFLEKFLHLDLPLALF